MAQRRVEEAAALVFPRPGDGLGVIGDRAFEEDSNIRREAGVLVEAALRLERLHSLQDRVVAVLVDDRHLARDLLAEVPLVVAAEDFLVEVEPFLKRVAGGADADDRPAGEAVFLDAVELLAVDGEAAREENHDIALVEIFK